MQVDESNSGLNLSGLQTLEDEQMECKPDQDGDHHAEGNSLKGIPGRLLYSK